MSNLLQLRCGECGEPEPDVTRCLRCVAADEISRLSSENELLREALELIAEPDIMNPELESIGIAKKALAALVSEGPATDG